MKTLNDTAPKPDAPQKPAGSAPPPPASRSFNKDLNLKSLNFLPQLKKLSQKFGKHAVFITVFVVLLVYLLMVFRISSFASAEPSPDQQVTIDTSIPKIDKDAIKQIQSLEQNNIDIHAFFENARSNPFQE